MDLTIYDVIQGPVVTDKAFRLNRDLKKLVLKIHPQANKPMVKEALEKLFNVKVDKINVMRRKGKRRMVNKRPVIGSMRKEAIVTLAEGYSLDLFDQAGKTVVKADQDKGTAV